jgi:hypothetical protein
VFIDRDLSPRAPHPTSNPRPARASVAFALRFGGMLGEPF